MSDTYAMGKGNPSNTLLNHLFMHYKAKLSKLHIKPFLLIALLDLLVPLGNILTLELSSTMKPKTSPYIEQLASNLAKVSQGKNASWQGYLLWVISQLKLFIINTFSLIWLWV